MSTYAQKRFILLLTGYQLYKSDCSDKKKWEFFQTVSVLLYGCTTWTLTLGGKSFMGAIQECCMLFWTNPGSSTPQLGTAGGSKNKLRSDILLWTPAKVYICQLCANTGYRLEDLPRAMTDRDRWWEIQGNQCYWHAFLVMMMMMMIIRINSSVKSD